MIYITGDTHGDAGRFSNLFLPDEHLWTPEDYLIVCGDFGFLFADDEREKRQLDELEKSLTRFCLLTAITKISEPCTDIPRRVGMAAGCTE